VDLAVWKDFGHLDLKGVEKLLGLGPGFGYPGQGKARTDLHAHGA